jgi:chromosome segregation ATPase
LNDTLVVATAAFVGFLAGALITFLIQRSRLTVAIARATSNMAVELAAVRERANRVLDLEAELAAKAHAEKMLQTELLRLTKLEAERGQQLRLVEEQLRDTRARLARSDEFGASCSAELAAVHQRAAARDVQASRVREFEDRLKQAGEANVTLTREIDALKESVERLAVELKCERERFAKRGATQFVEVSLAADRGLDEAANKH